MRDLICDVNHSAKPAIGTKLYMGYRLYMCM